MMMVVVVIVKTSASDDGGDDGNNTQLCITCSYKQGAVSVNKDDGTCKLPEIADAEAQEIPKSGQYT